MLKLVAVNAPKTAFAVSGHDLTVTLEYATRTWNVRTGPHLIGSLTFESALRTAAKLTGKAVVVA